MLATVVEEYPKHLAILIPAFLFGHFLVRPARLFFRLQGEDLSPFMHEVPRYFGAHEQFLKELGVKEEPSASDYVEVIFFLTLS